MTYYRRPHPPVRRGVDADGRNVYFTPLRPRELAAVLDWRAMVPLDDRSFQVGRPLATRRRRAAKAGTRPLRVHVDSWLAAGGWEGGRSGQGAMGRVALDCDDTPDARKQVKNWWYYECQARGWRTGRDATGQVATRWEVRDGRTWFCWWATGRE